MPMKVEPVEELKLLRQIQNTLTEMRKELQGSNKRMMERDDKRYELLLKIAETMKKDMQETQIMLTETRKELRAMHEQATKQENERYKRLMGMAETGRTHRFGIFYWMGLGALIGVLTATLGAVLWIQLT
jgi:uncharacterized membrane protein YukC